MYIIGQTRYFCVVQVKEFLQGAADEYLSETKKAEEWRKREEEMVNTTQSFYEEEQELEGAWFHLFGKSGAKPRRYWTSQRYATYPPSIPGE